MTLSEYLRLPWSVVREDHDDDGHYVALRVPELPGFVVAARSEDELEILFWDGLSAFLESYVDAGEVPPVPRRGMRAQPQLGLPPLDPRTEPENTFYPERRAFTGTPLRTQYGHVVVA